MGRIFIDGFEHGHLGLWDIGGAGTVSITTAAIDGNYSALTSGVAAMSRNLNATYSEIFITGKFNFKTLSELIYIYSLNKGANKVLSVGLTTENVIHLYRGTTAIASATTGAVTTNVDYRIEFQGKISSSTGVGKVLLDDETIINWTSNTKPAADDNFNILQIGVTAVSAQHMIVDDIIVDTTAFAGNTKIQLLIPNSTGTTHTWSPSNTALANYECVDEIPPSTADGVIADFNLDIDFYNISTLNANATAIRCIQVAALAEEVGTPLVPNIRLAIETNATRAYGIRSSIGAEGAPIYISKLWQNNPKTLTAFTVSEISSLQIGLLAVT